MIEDTIRITVLEVRGSQVKLGIHAPISVRVNREEVLERQRAEAGLPPLDLPPAEGQARDRANGQLPPSRAEHPRSDHPRSEPRDFPPPRGGQRRSSSEPRSEERRPGDYPARGRELPGERDRVGSGEAGGRVAQGPSAAGRDPVRIPGGSRVGRRRSAGISRAGNRRGGMSHGGMSHGGMSHGGTSRGGMSRGARTPIHAATNRAGRKNRAITRGGTRGRGESPDATTRIEITAAASSGRRPPSAGRRATPSLASRSRRRRRSREPSGAIASRRRCRPSVPAVRRWGQTRSLVRTRATRPRTAACPGIPIPRATLRRPMSRIRPRRPRAVAGTSKQPRDWFRFPTCIRLEDTIRKDQARTCRGAAPRSFRGQPLHPQSNRLLRRPREFGPGSSGSPSEWPTSLSGPARRCSSATSPTSRPTSPGSRPSRKADCAISMRARASTTRRSLPTSCGRSRRAKRFLAGWRSERRRRRCRC